MSSPYEVVVTSDASGQLWNSCVWDLQSGTSLLTFKGGTSASRTLDIINQDYLITASNTKPVLHLWPLQKRESTQMKMVCPGLVTSLTVTPDGSYCIAGIGEKIHIWQVCTGTLLAVLSRHYQVIRCVKCSEDGLYFVSGGDDNLVIVWSLGLVLAECGQQNTSSKPQHVWSSHSLPITDLHIGVGGSRGRVVSSSLDQTCRLWDLCSGELLCKFVFDVSIMSIAMDTAEFQLYAGGSNGIIYGVNLFEMPIRTERYIQNDKGDEGAIKFEGHSKQVTCLSVSIDGTQLVSGSHDFTVKVWDVYSGQCVKTLSHKGIITNAVIIPAPHGLIDADGKPSVIVQTFQRHLHTVQGESSSESSMNEVINIRINKSDSVSKDARKDAITSVLLRDIDPEILSPDEKDKKDDVASLKEEIVKLKGANEELYKFAVDEILHGSNKIT